MNRLERALRLIRKPLPTLEEVEQTMRMLESNNFVDECFEGWDKRNELPPENVLKALLEADFYERKRIRKY